MYTRHTLASLETVLFFSVFIIWLILSGWLWYYLGNRGFNWELMSSSDEMAGLIPTLIFCDLFSLIFLFWFVIPLLGYRTNESYDLDRLKVYPLPVQRVFTANLIGTFTDISVLLPLVSFVAVFFAYDFTPSQIPVGILLILALFIFLIIAGVTLVNALYILLPRLNLVAVGAVIAGGVLVWVVLLNMGVILHPAQTWNWYVFFRPEGVDFFRPYPAGQIAIALGAYLDGRYSDMTGPLIGFAGWMAGILLFNYILVAYLWAADPIGKVKLSRHKGDSPVVVYLKWLSKKLTPIFGQEAVAIFRKDMLEFATRSPYFFFYKILPGSIAPLIILLAMRWNLNNIDFVYPRAEVVPALLTFAFGIVIFIVVAQATLFSGNLFGFEGENIRTFMTFPTPRKNLLLGKNLFLGNLFFIDALILSLLMLLYFPKIYTFFAWFTLTLTLFILVLSLGNFISSIWPYWMPLDKPSFTMRTTVILSIVNTGLVVALAISFALPVAIVVVPHILEFDWLSYLMMPVALLYAVMFHKYTMASAVNLFHANEFLIIRRIADKEQL